MRYDRAPVIQALSPACGRRRDSQAEERLRGQARRAIRRELCARQEACGWYMQKFSRTEQQWQDLYFFREAEATQGDFDMMNFWIANHPDSEFQVGHAAYSCDAPLTELLLGALHAATKRGGEE